MSLLSVFGAGHWDIVTEKYADLFLVPAARAFYVLHISNHPMKQIVINHFHIHGDYIAGDSIDIHDNPSSTFCQGQHFPTTTTDTTNVEDVTPIVEHAPCPFLVPDKLTELGLYSLEQFETKFREAAESDAKTLAAFLKKYRQMGVLDFKGYSKKQIFTYIRAHFPTMRKYGYDNFVAYF